jgi:hypothetical protein
MKNRVYIIVFLILVFVGSWLLVVGVNRASFNNEEIEFYNVALPFFFPGEQDAANGVVTSAEMVEEILANSKVAIEDEELLKYFDMEQYLLLSQRRSSS